MNKTVLDNFIVLYSKNENIDFVTFLQEIEDEKSTSNLWEISSLNNISDTDHIVNQKIINLPTSDKLASFVNNSVSMEEGQVIKKNNLKYKLNNYTFPFLLDYIENYELSIKKIKPWIVCEQIDGSDFHSDINRDGLKHSYTVVVALNDGYIGGEVYFENRVGNDPIKLLQGDVLIYPSNNKYRHKESQVISGTKYTAISYF